jgi:hypothetical protein
MERDKVLGLPVVKPLMRGQLATLADLDKLKTELLLAIQAMLTKHNESKSKKWLKTYEVQKLLGISAGTLQTLRNSGAIPFSKIGGTIYYDLDEINVVIESKKKKLTTIRQK